MRSARGNIRSVQAESRLARADSPQRGPTRARQGPTHARRRPAHAQGGLAHLQRGPMRPQRGRCTLSAGRETFARKVFRVSRLKSLVFQKLALGLINGSRPSPKRQRSHQALSSRHAAGAREKALEARQSIGKHSENSHFETQSANFLPKARAARPGAPPSQSQSRTPQRPSFPKARAARPDALFSRSRRTVRREGIEPHHAPTTREETESFPKLKLPEKRRHAVGDGVRCIPAGFHGEASFRIPLTARRCALHQDAQPHFNALSRETQPVLPLDTQPHADPSLHRIFAIGGVGEHNEGLCALPRYESVSRTTATSTQSRPKDMVHRLEG